MLNKMPIIAYNVPEENIHIKPNMAMMRLNVFPSYKTVNSNIVPPPTQFNTYNTNNNDNKGTSSGIRSISIRSILGAPRTGCSSCRGG
jgi:hypothetical protein